MKSVTKRTPRWRVMASKEVASVPSPSPSWASMKKRNAKTDEVMRQVPRFENVLSTSTSKKFTRKSPEILQLNIGLHCNQVRQKNILKEKKKRSFPSLHQLLSLSLACEY